MSHALHLLERNAYRPTASRVRQVTARISWERPTPPQRVPLAEDAASSDWLMLEDERERVVPSRRSLITAGRYDLHHAIQYWGGYRAVHLPMQTCSSQALF